MPHKGGGKVLRGACALALSDEPLAGGVEYRALEFRIYSPELGIALHDSINCQIGNSLPVVGREVSSRFSRIECSGTSR